MPRKRGLPAGRALSTWYEACNSTDAYRDVLKPPDQRGSGESDPHRLCGEKAALRGKEEDTNEMKYLQTGALSGGDVGDLSANTKGDRK